MKGRGVLRWRRLLHGTGSAVPCMRGMPREAAAIVQHALGTSRELGSRRWDRERRYSARYGNSA